MTLWLILLQGCRVATRIRGETTLNIQSSSTSSTLPAVPTPLIAPSTHRMDLIQIGKFFWHLEIVVLYHLWFIQKLCFISESTNWSGYISHVVLKISSFLNKLLVKVLNVVVAKVFEVCEYLSNKYLANSFLYPLDEPNSTSTS